MSPCKLLTKTLLSLLLAATFQVILLCNAQSASSGVIFIEDCSSCTDDEKCVKRDETVQCITCAKNCSNVPTILVCASNGRTYNNKCEMEVAACNLDRVLRVEHEGIACPTLPPPMKELCILQQQKFDRHVINFTKNCNIQDVILKANAGSLTIDDLNLEYCHRPHCLENKFLERQCVSYAHEWCWCVDDEGKPKNFGKNLEEGLCTETKSCMVNGKKWKHEASYPNPDACGPCQCLNGVPTCYPALTFDLKNDILDETELKRLQDEILRIFYVQYIHKNVDQENLLDISNPRIYDEIREDSDINVSLSLKKNIVNFKFDSHDTTKDDLLQSSEYSLLRRELLSILQCVTLLNYIEDVMDTDNDNYVSRKEFQEFFISELGEDDEGSALVGISKRDTAEHGLNRLVRRQLSRRNKFYYTLV